MSKFEKFCWIWNYKNACYSELSNQNYMLVKMEDLVHSDNIENTFKQLVTFLGQNFDEGILISNNKKINKSNPIRFPPYKEWTDQHKAILHQHCDELMKSMKYD